MKQCFKITFSANTYKGFLQTFVKKHAQRLGLEGVARCIAADTVHVVVCGKSEPLEDFLDVLHKGTKKANIDNIQVEPSVRPKDYRGVFRVIE